MTDHALTPYATGVDEVDKAHRRDLRRQKITTVFRYAVLTLVGLIMIYPLVWLIGASFKTNSEIFANP
ncbi:MAG: carbohydrate ABC transporter permease, partial [Allorhizobium sp.]